MINNRLVLLLFLPTFFLPGCAKIAKETAERAGRKADEFAESFGFGTEQRDREIVDRLNDIARDQGEELKQWISKRVATRASIATIRRIEDFEKSSTPFVPVSFSATMRGNVESSGKILPAQYTIRSEIACSSNTSFELTFFIEQTDRLTRLDLLLSATESLNGDFYREQTYTEIFEVDEFDSSFGTPLLQEAEEVVGQKSQNNTVFDYRKPKQAPRRSVESSLFPFASERFLLSKIEQGVSRFQYLMADHSERTLRTKHEVVSRKGRYPDQNFDVWLVRETERQDVEEDVAAISVTESLITRNGIPIWETMEFEGFQLEFWLDDFEALPTKPCAMRQ